MTCIHCNAAQTRKHYGGLQRDCPDCQVRELAKAPPHIQAAAFDRVEREAGPAARQAIRERAKNERDRLRAMK